MVLFRCGRVVGGGEVEEVMDRMVGGCVISRWGGGLGVRGCFEGRGVVEVGWGGGRWGPGWGGGGVGQVRWSVSDE